jgi:hypothetical protein
MTATAVQAGAMGNSITVQFASPSASAGTVAVTVTATEVYEGLTMTAGALGTALGETQATATGLVYLLTESTDGQIPEPGSVGLNTSSQFPVQEAADNTKTAFTLVPTTVAADASLLGVTIAPDASNPLTAFTLTVSWTKTATVSLASLLTNSTNPFAYLVAFSGTSGPLPVAGKVTLGGGNPTTQASANIYASS